MRGTRQNAIRVGVFVVVSGALLAGGLLWLAGTRFFRPVHTYTVVFERSVSGLNAGANVEYQGVVVGRVRDMRLTGDVPPKVAVIVDLDPQTAVHQDVTAVLVGSLVTGIKFIQLVGGTPGAPPLPPDGTIHGDAPSLEEFRDRLAEIADRVTDILRNLQQNVFTHENSEKLNHFLDDLGSVANTLNRALETVQVKETSKDFAKLVKQLGDVAEKTDRILGDFQSHGKTLYATLESALKDIDATSKSARALVSRADTGVATTGRSVDRALEELTKTISRLQETLDVIQSDPSLLLRGRPVPPRELRAMSAARIGPLLVAAGLAGCALLSRKTSPAVQYYVLAVQGAPATPLPAPLELGQFTADQPYATERIAYRTSPYRIDYYVYNRWAADPRSMIAAATRDYLDRGAPPDDRPPLVLTAHIRRIEEVDEENGARRGVLALDVKVVQDGRVVLARDFEESEPARTGNVEAVVEALSRALGRILDQVATALAAPAAEGPPHAGRPR